MTSPALLELMSREIPVSWHSFGGWFAGHTIGTGHKNVELRTAQYRQYALCLRQAWNALPSFEAAEYSLPFPPCGCREIGASFRSRQPRNDDDVLTKCHRFTSPSCGFQGGKHAMDHSHHL